MDLDDLFKVFLFIAIFILVVIIIKMYNNWVSLNDDPCDQFEGSCEFYLCQSEKPNVNPSDGTYYALRYQNCVMDQKIKQESKK